MRDALKSETQTELRARIRDQDRKITDQTDARRMYLPEIIWKYSCNTRSTQMLVWLG